MITEFTDLTIAAVPGDASNSKVAYPDDLAAIEATLRDRSRT